MVLWANLPTLYVDVDRYVGDFQQQLVKMTSSEVRAKVYECIGLTKKFKIKSATTQ